jgi:lysine-N-methylase
LAIWLDGAAQSLIELAEARARLGAPTHARHEAFYVKTLVFGHQLVSHQLSLVATLRDRAIRVLLARAAVSCAPDDPSSSAPLTAVEAMMRGQGLDAYAVGLE